MKMKMKMKMKLLAVAGAITMASAAMPTLAQTVSGGTVTYSDINDYTTIGGLITLFNPAAGTLAGVTIQSNYDFNSVITVTPSSTATGMIQTQSAQQVFSDNPAINSVLTNFFDTTSAAIGSDSLNPAEFNVNGSSSMYRLPAGNSSNYASNGSGTKTITLTSASQLSAFYASSNMTSAGIGFQTLTGLDINALTGNVTATATTTSSDTFSIIYTYAANAPAVPEAATWAMMMVGFGVVGGSLRRRRSITTRVQVA